VVWGDALYFRDLAHPHYEATWHYRVTRERLLTLVALFELYGLPDCAAELLLAWPQLTTEAERTRLLDLLVVSAGFDTTYAAHMARFERDPRAFYPRSYTAPAAAAGGTPAAPAPAAPVPAAPVPAAPDTGFGARLRALRRRLLSD
jgi:hypothetical protein